MSGHIALLCKLHPASQAKQDRCLSILRRSAREYYRRPSAQCTTWSYYTPLPASKTQDTEQLLGGLEIYDSKSALQAQVDDKEYFQYYHGIVKEEGLYAHSEELVAWYLDAGFVARGSEREEGGQNVVVSVTKLRCKDREAVLGALREFSDWVRSSEPDVLTYAIFTRPKAADEILIFVRYADTKALRSHDQAPEHQNVGKLMAAYLDLKKTSTTVWKELDDSFVSPVSKKTAESSVDTAKL